MKRAWITILEVIAVVAITMATFMPMKAILLLASDSVPSFFPEVLITGGPLAAALSLLALSAIAGVLATFLNRFLATRNNGITEQDHETASLLPADLHRVASRGTDKTGPAAEFLIMIVFGVGLLVISPTFFLVTSCWLFIALVWTRVSRRANQLNEPSELSHEEWARRYRKVVQQSMLPSTIVIALVTLLVSTPRLGATGALLAIVLARRFQIAVAHVAFDLLPRSSRHDESDMALTDGRAGTPKLLIEELSRAADGEAFWTDISSHVSPGGRFSISSGNQGKRSFTLMPESLSADTPGYLRVFSRDAQHMRLLEFQFRSNLAPVSLFPGDVCQMGDIAEHPVLQIRTSSQLVADAIPGKRAVNRWFSRLTKRCVRSPDFQEWAASRVQEFPEVELQTRLASALSIPGLHKACLMALSSRIWDINEALRQRPLSWIPAANLNPSFFAEREDGDLSLLFPVGWSLGRVGDRVDTSRVLSLEEESDSQASSEVIDNQIELIARKRSRLLRQLRLYDLRGANATGAEILQVDESCLQ